MKLLETRISVREGNALDEIFAITRMFPVIQVLEDEETGKVFEERKLFFPKDLYN